MKKTRKRGFIDRLFDMNKLVVLCIFFTVNTIINVVSVTIVTNEPMYLSLGMMLWTFALLSAPILPFAVLQRLWKSEFIGEKDYLLWTGVVFHYVFTCALIVLFTFIRSRFEPLPPSFYITRLGEATFLYILISLLATIVDFAQTTKLNKNLRKIQNAQDIIRRQSV